MVRTRTHVMFGTIDLTLRHDGQATTLASAGTPLPAAVLSWRPPPEMQ